MQTLARLSLPYWPLHGGDGQWPGGVHLLVPLVGQGELDRLVDQELIDSPSHDTPVAPASDRWLSSLSCLLQ